MKQHKGFLQGAMWLTIAGLFSKVLSAGYRIPLQNIAGDKGLYVYQQVYPFLSLAWLLSIYGFPAAISSLNINQHGKNRSTGVYSAAFFYLLMFGTGMFIMLNSGADYLAVWMGDPDLARPIELSSYVYLVLPLTSLFRGIQQASGNMNTTAFSQMTEQLIRVSGILLVAIMFWHQGRSLYEMGAGAAFASVIGGLAASVFLLWNSRFVFSSSHLSKWAISRWSSVRFVWKTLMITGLVFSLNYMLLLLLQVVDVFTMIPALQEYGLTMDQARAAKGVFDRGQPLVQFGIIFGSSLSLAMIPALQGSREEIFSHDIKSALKLTFLFSLPAAAGLMAIFPAVNILLYKNDQGTLTLQVFSALIFFVSIMMSVSVILQKFDFVKRQIFFFGGTMVVKWLLNIWLIPVYGITGAALASVVSLAVLVLIFLYVLKKYVSLSLLDIVPWAKSLFALLLMLITVKMFNYGAIQWLQPDSRLDYLWIVVFSCMIGAILYLGTLLKLNVFTERELRELPYREKLVKRLGVKSE